MPKPGIDVDIPGRGRQTVRFLVTDYSGTLSCGGKLTAGVQERLLRLHELLEVHVLTSDTFGTVRRELVNIPVNIEVLDAEAHDVQKQRYVEALDTVAVFAMGNGNNDRLMLGSVAKVDGIAVAVDNGEGCAVAALSAAQLHIHGAANALDLLIDPRRLKAGLRY